MPEKQSRAVTTGTAAAARLSHPRYASRVPGCKEGPATPVTEPPRYPGVLVLAEAQVRLKGCGEARLRCPAPARPAWGSSPSGPGERVTAGGKEDETSWPGTAQLSGRALGLLLYDR